MMIPKTVLTFFTSGSGFPAESLTPEICIIDLSDNAIVTQSNMVEVGKGYYKFIFNDYDPDEEYAIRCDAMDNSLDFRYTFAGNESFVDDIWGVQRENHKIKGSFGEALRDVYDIEVGSWRITATGEMELLRSGSNDVIARFDLRKLDGSDLVDPENEDPFRRDRI